MKPIAILCVCTTLAVGVTSTAVSQSDATIHPAKRESASTIVLFDPPRVLEPEVTFLSEVPEIDGRLDRDLERLAVRKFSRLSKSNPENPIVPCTYRLAYGTGFFYAYVEAEGEQLTFRDRAYQNGDGFAMVLCLPTPDDDPTEEFYVLSCSAVNESRLEWTRRIFWYYNVDQIFVPTSEETKLEFGATHGKIHFELLLPWKDVHPYHPWISDGIGFNLMFTKAIGERETNWYRVIPGTVGAENTARWYGHLVFESPRVEGRPQTFVLPSRGNVEEGEALRVIAVTTSGEPVTEEVTVRLEPEEEGNGSKTQSKYGCARGITREEFDTGSGELPQGDYTFRWSAKKSRSRGQLNVTILPRFDRGLVERQLEEAARQISPGSATTLELKIQRAARLLDDLPPYEVASYERRVLERVREQMDQALRGADPYAALTGALRRGFRSDVDGTLQPYVVRVPEDYDPNGTYPLLVFLHGSASTEADILGFPYLSEGGMIEMGPFGRGRSNGFATPEAQTDVAEAMKDAIANYPIDTDRVILTGFSMGGYGAYRTFYETPEKFAALAVFSGSPDLGRAYAPGSDPPDFLDEEHLKCFHGLPVFIYHGEQDRNVSFEKTVRVVEKLKAAGARVEFHSDPDRGHEAPGDAAIRAYHRWLRNALSEP